MDDGQSSREGWGRRKTTGYVAVYRPGGQEDVEIEVIQVQALTIVHDATLIALCFPSPSFFPRFSISPKHPSLSNFPSPVMLHTWIGLLMSRKAVQTPEAKLEVIPRYLLLLGVNIVLVVGSTRAWHVGMSSGAYIPGFLYYGQGAVIRAYKVMMAFSSCDETCSSAFHDTTTQSSMFRVLMKATLLKTLLLGKRSGSRPEQRGGVYRISCLPFSSTQRSFLYGWS